MDVVMRETSYCPIQHSGVKTTKPGTATVLDSWRRPVNQFIQAIAGETTLRFTGSGSTDGLVVIDPEKPKGRGRTTRPHPLEGRTQELGPSSSLLCPVRNLRMANRRPALMPADAGLPRSCRGLPLDMSRRVVLGVGTNTNIASSVGS